MNLGGVVAGHVGAIGHIADRDRHVLAGRSRAIAGRNDDVIDIVAARIGRIFIIRCRVERHFPGFAVDREQGRIRAGDRVGDRIPLFPGRLDDIGRGLGFGHRAGGRRLEARRPDLSLVGHRDRDRAVRGIGAVRSPDNDVIDIVGAGIGRRFKVRRSVESDKAGRGIDAEQARIRTAGDRIGHAVAVGIGSVGIIDRTGPVLDEAGRRPRGEGRGVVVDIVHSHADGLAVGQRAVRDRNGHVIDIVTAGIGRVFMIGRRDKAERAGIGVDGEQGRIRARDRVGQAVAVRIGRAGRDHRRGVLVDRHRAGDRDHRCLVDIGHRNRDRLIGGQRAVAGANDDVIDIVRTGIGGVLEIGRADKAEFAGIGVDGEQGRIGSARNRIGDGVAVAIGRRRGIARRRHAFGNRRRRARGEGRGEVIGRRHRDGHILAVRQRPVGRRDGDVIDVVAIGIGRAFEIRRRYEGNLAGIGVDGEQGRVIAGERIGQRIAVRVRRRRGKDRRGEIFRDRHRVGRGHHRCLIHIVDGDLDIVLAGQLAVAGPDFQFIDIIAIGVGGVLIVQLAAGEGQLAGHGINREQRRIGTAQDRIGDGRSVTVCRGGRIENARRALVQGQGRR